MSVSSKWVKHTGGETLVFHAHGNESRWYDAIGANTRKWNLRYGADFTTAAEFTYTEIGAGGAITQGITAGVRAAAITDVNKWDSVQLQVVGTPFQLAAGYPAYFGCSMAMDSASLGDWFVGLASTDSTIFTAGADTLDIAASAAGFYGAASTAIYAYNEIHADSKSTTATPIQTTGDRIYEFVYDGVSGIDYFLDGALVGRHTTFIPTVVLTPSFALKASSAAARKATINWMRAIQLA
jgi:hypothetical protein